MLVKPHVLLSTKKCSLESWLWLEMMQGEKGKRKSWGNSKTEKERGKGTESPEGRDGCPDTFCRAEESVSQMRSCSRVTAHSRFLSSFHPFPHLFPLRLIGRDWMWPADAKHAQCPAQGQRVKTCNTPIQRQKAQQRLEQNRWSCAVMAAVTLLCHYYYNLAHLRKDSK